MRTAALALMAMNVLLIASLVVGEAHRRALIASCAAAHARWGVAWSDPWTREHAIRQTLAAASELLLIERELPTWEREFPPASGREGERYQDTSRAPSWIFHAGSWRRMPASVDFGSREWARRHAAVLRAMLAREEYWELSSEVCLSLGGTWFPDRAQRERWIARARPRRDHLLRILSALDTAPLEVTEDDGADIAHYRLDPPVDGTQAVDLVQAALGDRYERWLVER